MMQFYCGEHDSLGENSLCPECCDHTRRALPELATAASHRERLEDACKRLLAAYEAEETEHGFPFSFELREAHRALKALFPTDPKEWHGFPIKADERIPPGVVIPGHPKAVPDERNTDG